MLFLDVWSGHVKKSDFLIEKISKKKQTLNTLETLLLVSGQTIMSFWTFPPFPSPYFQVRHPFLKGLCVVPQGPLLLQELGVPSISSWLEEAIVVDIPQRLTEG